MDFLNKFVFVKVKRKGKFREHKGLFLQWSRNEICLLNDEGKRIWIPKPNQYYDEIKELKE